jgi:hypothetical protein
MERQNQRGGDRQLTIEYLVTGNENHGPALSEHHVLLACVCGAAEDVDGDAVGEALLGPGRARLTHMC